MEKDEKEIETEKIQDILNKAIDEKLKQIQEYKETPTKKHLDDVVSKLELADDSAILLVTFNPDTKGMQFYGIKATTSDLVAMEHYAMAKTTQNDLGGVLDCVSTVARQAELNDCWVEHNETPEEIKDESDEQ